MRPFEFILLVAGLDPWDDSAVAALLDRNHDITVGQRGELAEVGVYVEAPDAKTAALHAIEVVETAVTCSRVVGVEEDLVAASDVAERLDCSAELIRLWATGQRGPGGFPAPRGFVGSHQTRVWRWADVHAWLAEHRPDDVADMPEPIPSAVADELNANHLSRQPKVQVLPMQVVTASRSTYHSGRGLPERREPDVGVARTAVTA